MYFCTSSHTMSIVNYNSCPMTSLHIHRLLLTLALLLLCTTTYANQDIQLQDSTETEKPVFFENTDFDKFFKEFYIKGIDDNTEYCLRTFNKNEAGAFNIYIGDDKGSVIHSTNNTTEDSVVYAYSTDSDIEMWIVLQNLDEYKTSLWQNNNTAIASLNRETCCNLDYSPAIAEYISTHSDTTETDKTVFFENTNFDKFFKEFYIKGIDDNTEYCLRTFNKNEAGAFNIYIGDDKGSVIHSTNNTTEDSVVYAYSTDSDIEMWIVLQNLDEYKTSLWQNNNTAIASLNRETCCNLDYSPAIAEYISTHSDPLISNGAYPYECDTLRVLAVGNSFTGDCTAYLKRLMVNLGINLNKVVMSQIVRGTSSFETWIEYIENNSSFQHATACKENPYCEVVIGQVRKDNVQEMLAVGWDIVIIQQSCALSGIFSTYSNCDELVELLKEYIGNENLCVFYNMPYGHSTVEGEPFGYSDWKNYVNVTKRVVEKIGIDKIIPTGTAIQKARNTELTYGGLYDNLTRDNWHVNSGTGRYIAACTWYEALFAPYFGVSVINSTLDILETERPDNEEFINSFVAVTDDNRALCNQCAFYAIQEPYSDSVDCFTDNPVITASDETSYIYGYDNTIFIEGVADDTIVRIYNAGGMLLRTTTAARASHITLPDGLYLVQAGNKAQKIVL